MPRRPWLRIAFLALYNRFSSLLTTQRDRIYAFADQLLYGGGNMLAVILFARALSVEIFAAYIAAVAVYFVIFGFHRACLVMPFLLSAKEDTDHDVKSQWFWAAFLTSLGLAMVMFLTTFGLDLAGADANTVMIAAFAAIQAPPLLLQEFGKRWLYQHDLGHAVVISSALSLFTMLSGALLLLLGYLPDHLVSTIIAASALLAVVVQFLALKPAMTGPKLRVMGALLTRRLSFSMWQSGTHLPYVIYNNGFPLLMAAIGSPAVVAGFAAVRNLLAPSVSLVSAVDSTDKIRAVRAYRDGGPAAARRSTDSTRRVLLVLGIPFLVFLAILSGPIQQLVYDGQYYMPWELVVMTAYSALLFINQPYETLLTVAQKGKLLLLSRVISAVTTIAVALYLIPAYGVMGAILSLVIAQAINCTLLSLAARNLHTIDKFEGD